MGQEIILKEITELSKNVSVEKREDVQNVLNQVFNGVAKMREQLDLVAVIDENDKVNMKLANTIRLGVRQVRLDAEKTFDAKRSEVQQQMLAYKTEDALWLKAKQTMQLLTKEIEENARWKEETRERFDKEQQELKIQKRILLVSKFNPEINRTEFENMSDEMFGIFLSGIEKAYTDKKEAEEKEEAERLAKLKAEEEERERIKKENERLKKEAEEKEKQLFEERKKAEVERLKLEEKAKKEKEEVENKLREEREKARKLEEQNRIERGKAEKERKEIEDKIIKEQKEKEENERKLKNASDKEKLKNLSEQIKNIDFPVVQSPEAKNVLNNAKNYLKIVIDELIRISETI